MNKIPTKNQPLFYSTVLSYKVKTRLRELDSAARGSQDAGSRNSVFTFQSSTVHCGGVKSD